MGTKIFWGVDGCDLVGGSGQGFAFGGVLALAGYGSF
jgi:hypothetical protein